MLHDLLRWTASGIDELAWARLALERKLALRGSAPPRRRALVTVCRGFPTYSHTFVYRELTELARSGFALRLLYSKRHRPSGVPAEFPELWKARRRDLLNSWSGHHALSHYERRMPGKVSRLMELLGQASEMDPIALRKHKHVRQAFAFTRLVEAWRPDYLHSYFFYERSLMVLVASFLLDLPRGITCYADHLLEDYELKVVPLHLEQCSVVVATSERIRRELASIAPGVDPSKIVLKPNAIAASRFPVREPIDAASSDPFRIVCVSRIEPKKGLLFALEAMALLRERGLRVRLHLVGAADDAASSRDYQRSLRRRRRELGLLRWVRFERRQTLDGVRRFLASAHLFIAPFVELPGGDKDGIPTALLEAMATGLAVVVTDAGSMLEVVDHGVDGVVVPQRDPAALASAIEALLRDPSRRRALGRSAAEKIRREFDVGTTERRFHQRIEELVEASRRRT